MTIPSYESIRAAALALAGCLLACLYHEESARGAEYSESINAAEKSLHQLLGSLISSPNRVVRARDAFRHVVFCLDSKSLGADFSFQWEYRGQVPGRGSRMHVGRRSYECRASNQVEFVFDGSGFPARVAVNGDRYCLDGRPPWLHQEHARWAYVVREGPTEGWATVPDAQAGVGGAIQVDLADYLRRVLEADDPELEWDPITRSITASKSNGVVYTLRFRTPNDAERFGTCLSQVRNDTVDETSSFAWSHFILGRASPLRFHQPTIDEITAALVPCQTIDSRLELPDEPRTAQAENALSLWQLAVPKTDDEQGGKACDVGPLLDKIDSLLLRKGSEHAQLEALKATALAAELIMALRDIKLSMRRGMTKCHEHLCDDPLLLWRAFEMEVGSRVAATAFNRCLRFINTAPIRKDFKYALCDAVADLGVPGLDFLNSCTTGGGPSEDPVVSAILKSHWQWPCSQEEENGAELLLTAENCGSATEWVVVEALVRMGRVQQVPPDRLNAWFDSAFICGDVMGRDETLRVLSEVIAGRKYLCVRAVDELIDVPLRTAIIDMLAYRALATLRTKRFDFMPEDECTKVLALRRKE